MFLLGLFPGSGWGSFQGDTGATPGVLTINARLPWSKGDVHFYHETSMVQGSCIDLGLLRSSVGGV